MSYLECQVCILTYMTLNFRRTIFTAYYRWMCSANGTKFCYPSRGCKLRTLKIRLTHMLCSIMIFFFTTMVLIGTHFCIKWILILPKYQLNKIWLENTLSSEPFCTSQLLQFFNFRDEMTSSLNFAIDAHVLAYWHPFVVHFLYELWPKSM